MLTDTTTHTATPTPTSTQGVAPIVLRSFPFATPALSATVPVRLAPAGAALWRVIDLRGRVIGHLQIVEHDLGLRYRARRFHSATGRFRELGDFWSADDAVGCLRHAA